MARTTEKRRRGASGAEVQRYLSGADYPATRKELIELADDNFAPDEVLDLLETLPRGEYEDPTDVMESLGGQGRSSRREETSPRRERDSYESRSSRREEDSSRREGNGYDRRRQMDEDDQENRRSSSRSQARDPDPSRVSSQRRPRSRQEEAEIEEQARRREERDRGDDDWDRRLAGHETDAIADARAMRHGYDGRGRVRNEENDRRLGDHPSRAIDDARRMRHGYDGRGRVRKFGPGEVDERISDDFERYEENRRRREEDPEPDDRGVYSRRRKDDEGRPIEGYREEEFRRDRGRERSRR